VRHNRHRHLEQEEVITAAVSVAFETGLHAVSAATVAARLGAHEKSVTSLWPDSDALVAITFSRVVAAELAEVKRVVLANPSPLQQLLSLLETLAEPVRLDTDAVWLESWSLGRRNQALGEVVRSEEAAWHTFVAAVVRRGVKSGDFGEVDPDEVAAHLLATIDGVNAYSLVGYRSDIDRLRLLHMVARMHLGAAVPLGGTSAAAEPEPESLSVV
jgi:AcrR family transcriptional regulator